MRVKHIILFLLIASCSGRIKESSDSSQSEFLELMSVLPKVKIPFEVYCSKCCDHPSYNSDDARLLKYLPQGSALMGMISQTNSYTAILVTYPADMIIPAVVIYDSNGTKIDEMTFMGQWCDRDFDYLGKQYFRINKDLTFSEIDTSYTFEMDSLNHSILDTTDIRVERKDFILAENGKIKIQ